MADISLVKIYFLEPYYGNGFGTYTDASASNAVIPVVQISNITTGSGGLKIITTALPHGLDTAGTEIQIILPNAVTPQNMMLDIDANAPGAPGSCGVTVIDNYRLQLSGNISGIAIGDNIMLFAWTDRTRYIKANSLGIPLQYDKQDMAIFTVQTTANEFIPYAGMQVIIKYGGAFTLFGGMVKDAPISIANVYANANTEIEIPVSCDTFAALARRRHILQEAGWRDIAANVIFEGNNDYQGTMQYMIQEGVTVGQIDSGVYIDKYPINKKLIFALNGLYDAMAQLSGYQWYINADKGFYFVPLILPYDNSRQPWEPYITDAPFPLTADGEFTDFMNGIIETSISDYNNTIDVEGGEDDNKRRPFSLGRNDSQIRLNQYRCGGSGVWGMVVNNHNISQLATAEITAVSGNVITTDLPLIKGDYLFDITNDYAAARVSHLNEDGSIQLSNSIWADGTSGLHDIVGIYPQALMIIRNRLKESGTALPKKITFSTLTIGNESKIWAPNQRLSVNLSGFGPAGSGYFLIEKVEYRDVKGDLQIDITASLKDSTYFSETPQLEPADPETVE